LYYFIQVCVAWTFQQHHCLCQRVSGLRNPSPSPQWRFSHLHVDLVGPLQYSNNFNYIFTIIDITSKWMEAVPLSETSSAAAAQALTFTWISRFGVPEIITGHNSLPIFGFSFARCLTSCTDNEQLIILGGTAQSRDCTAASRMRFAHALL
jgi:hypothetical protein